MIMNKCTIFVRTSTAEQSVESQLADLRPYAVHRGWEVVSEIRLEGTSAYRGGMDAVLARLVREGQEGHRVSEGEGCESGSSTGLEGQAAEDAQALPKPRWGID